jgi:hypothetical protein
MPTTNQLIALTQLQASDQIAVWSTNNGDTRSATLAVLIDFLSEDAFDYFVASEYVQTEPLTVATLPSAATAGTGARAFVTDANANTYNTVVAGGGSNSVPVFSTGTQWRIG